MARVVHKLDSLVIVLGDIRLRDWPEEFFR